MNTFLQWLSEYGYIILFLSMFLELIAFPIPTELLMAYSGFLVFQHQLNWAACVFAAGSGCFLGVTLSYWIGFKLGYPFFHRYGRRLHLGPERLDKVSDVFKKHGLKFLLISYFIPGVRHLTGYFSGITQIRYRNFGLFSAMGLFIWTSTFITLGDLLGPKWRIIETSAKKYMVIIVILLIITGLVIYLIKVNLNRIKSFIIKSTVQINATFRSRGRLKLLITAAAVMFILFLSFSVGLIQDFVSRDFGEFNRTVLLISTSIFQQEWASVMNVFLYLSSYWGLAVVSLLTVGWILAKGKNRWLEFRLWVLLYAGGFAYVRVLHLLFGTAASSLHLTAMLIPVFQSEQLVMSVIVYGFFAFLLSRHVSSYSVKILTTILVLLVLFIVGVGHLYFDLQLPSDVAAGYVFGGVWLSFTVLLLEILRLVKLNFSPETKNVSSV